MKVWYHKMHRKHGFGVRFILVVQFALLLFCSCGMSSHTQRSTSHDDVISPSAEVPDIAEHSSSVFLVMYDSEIGKEPLQKAIKEFGCEIVYDYKFINGMALKKPVNKTLEETMEYFRTVKGVISVEYDHINQLFIRR